MKKCIFIFLAFLLVSPIVFAQKQNPIKVLFQEATQALGKGNPQRAIELYEKILEVVPDFAPAYHYLGLSHQALGTDLRETLWLFKRATELNPAYAAAYDNLCRSYYSLGMFDEAEEAGLMAVRADSNLGTAHLALGWTYLVGKEQPKDAVYHFEKALQQNDTNYVQFGLGMAYFKSGQKFRTLEMITNLRQRGKEQAAKQLEDMVRSAGTTIHPPVFSAPLIMPKREQGVLVKDAPTFSSQSNFRGDMKVRLKEKIDTVKPAPSSGVQRIRALQQNTLRQPKGSGF